MFGMNSKNIWNSVKDEDEEMKCSSFILVQIIILIIIIEFIVLSGQ